MTAQVMETLIYKGEECAMASEPLRSYLSECRPNLSFRAPHTACWRGYTGTWQIKDNKLFITDISTFGPSIEEIFSEPLPVFARWYTGEIRVTQGDTLLYVHMGYGSLYEKEIYIKIKNGLVVSEEETDNRENFESCQRQISTDSDSTGNIDPDNLHIRIWAGKPDPCTRSFNIKTQFVRVFAGNIHDTVSLRRYAGKYRSV